MNRPASRWHVSVVALMLLAPGARSEERPTAPKTEITLASYDIRELVDGRYRMGRGKKAGPLSVDHIIKSIVSQHPAEWLGPDARFTIEVVNGAALDVRTTGKRHEEIEQLLAALRRLHDVSITCTAVLYEVDADFYAKALKPVLADDRSPLGVRAVHVGLELARNVHQHGRLAKPIETAVVDNGDEATVFALEIAHLYATQPGKLDRFETAYSGVTMSARTTASADRRFIEVQVDQQVRNFQGTTRRDVFDANFERVTIDVPAIAATSCREEVTVADGEHILVPVHLRPAARGKVYVLILKPEIYIQAEQDFFLENKLRAVWSRMYYWLRVNQLANRLDRLPGVSWFLIRWLERAGF